jgi:transcriptional regulator of arginine metabolism
MKARRQSAIRDVVQHEPVRSQEQLRQRLAVLGFRVTQATLSRDIKDLGLVKRSVDGAYQSADESPAPAALGALAKAFTEYLLSVEAAQQLVVVKTGPGQAQLLGLAIDRSRLPDVVGTVAGDDTVLVIGRNPKGARAIVRQLNELAGR